MRPPVKPAFDSEENGLKKMLKIEQGKLMFWKKMNLDLSKKYIILNNLILITPNRI